MYCMKACCIDRVTRNHIMHHVLICGCGTSLLFPANNGTPMRGTVTLLLPYNNNNNKALFHTNTCTYKYNAQKIYIYLFNLDYT